MQGLDNYKTATPDWINRLDEETDTSQLEADRKEAYETFLYLAEETKFYMINGTNDEFMQAREVELLAWDDFLTIDKQLR